MTLSKMTLSKFTILLALAIHVVARASTPPAAADERWISLYNGRETGFQESLRQRVKDLCDSYGVPYQLTADRQILVPATARANILTLIAGHYTK